MPRRWYGALIAAVLLTPAAAFAQQTRAGAEFRVNSYTTNAQRRPKVLFRAGGEFLVTWSGIDSLDGSSYGIIAQRYDAAGAAVGAQFRVNSFTPSYQYSPRAAGDRRGNFVVVWSSYAQDGDAYGVFGQRFDAGGAPRGGEFQVNTYTGGGQGSAYYFSPSNHDVGMSPTGSFVVVWGSYDNYQDGELASVQAQRYDANGVRQGGEFRVNTYTTGDEALPAVGVAGNGSFVVVWQQPDGGLNGIQGQRFDASGARLGAEFRVNAATSGNQVGPSIAVRDDGSFVVVWSVPTGELFARTFSSTGAPGPEFQVNSYVTGYQYTYGGISVDKVGNFVINWNSSAGDGSNYAIFGKRYTAAGVLRGAEFLVNAYTTGNQNMVSVASDEVGNIISAWRDGSRDNSGSGVYAQRHGGLRPTALAVNGAGNLVWEPGETVDVRPTWRNQTGASQTFTGSLISLTGPAGATYTIVDGSADYGTVPNGGSSLCPSCYVVSVSNDPRPVTHWDATAVESIVPEAQGQQKGWSLHIGNSFVDVPSGHPFFRFIEILLHHGITGGCNANSYCPTFTTTREQMAVFVLVAKEGAGYLPPACTTPVFNDVPASSPFCRWIEELARRGVVAGCAPNQYCPTTAVTREQMAIFVLRTLDPALNPPACGTPVFNDVPASSPFCRWVEELFRRNIVAGCGGNNYCPQSPVTRDQMGVFISSTFSLSLYGL
jgi:hypothetical protein